MLAPLVAMAAVVTIAAVWIIVDTLLLGIPPMPSSRAMREAMVALTGRVGPPASLRIVELGSGWGGLSRRAAAAFPDALVTGVERAFLPYLAARLAASIAGIANLGYRRADLRTEDIQSGSVLLCYLSPQLMTDLAGRLGRLDGGGPWSGAVVSAAFALPGHEPVETLRLGDLMRTPVSLYLVSRTAAHSGRCR